MASPRIKVLVWGGAALAVLVGIGAIVGAGIGGFMGSITGVMVGAFVGGLAWGVIARRLLGAERFQDFKQRILESQSIICWACAVAALGSLMGTLGVDVVRRIGSATGITVVEMISVAFNAAGIGAIGWVFLRAWLPSKPP